MEYVKNLFSLKNNNLLIDVACVIEVYKLQVKISSFIRKVIEVEVCSVSEALCFHCQVSKQTKGFKRKMCAAVWIQ
jgi:hypothetical protein